MKTGDTLNKEKLLRDALIWSLREGISYSSYSKCYIDMGCGCCSDHMREGDIPEEFRELLKEVQEELNN